MICFIASFNNRSAPFLALSGITVSSGQETLTPDFDPNTKNYTVRVKNNVVSDTVTGKHLEPGSNVVKITVTAEDKTTKVYTVNIIRSNDDATLKTLIVSSGTEPFNPEFDPAITNYTIYVENSVVSIDVTGTPNDPTANVSNVTGK